LVRFFGGKTRTGSKDAAAPAGKAEVGKVSAAPPPPAPATKTTAAAGPAAKTATKTTRAPRSTAASAEPAAKKTTTTRRRTTATRPPRRDWAAEAAAAPIDAPAPKPSSLATGPVPVPEESEPAAPATKRRRGTRGGRGRKKPGAAANTPSSAATPTDLAVLPSLNEVIERNGHVPAPSDVTLENVVAHQAAVLEAFAREVSVTLRSLQTAVSDLQHRGEHPSAATSHPRVGIFVDVPNLIYAAERRNIDLDFGRVLEYFTRGRELVRATAYAPISDDPSAKLESQRFVHYFIGLPYRLVTKPLKRFADGSMKANFDIELAIDILTMSDRLDIVVLMSGDGDFRRVVDLIAARGVRVEVVAFAEAASSELKAVADRYVDVGQHLDEFKVQR
jgi:uncharacterized LabA/DUF88 family protein